MTVDEPNTQERTTADCRDGMKRYEPLRLPVQARARRTVEKILQASIDILIDEGVTGLNTNKVASRAGVNIATLYAYFPDKTAIIAHLATRFEGMRAASVEEYAAELVTTGDYRKWFADSIDRMIRFRLDEPGGLAIRRALLATPELMHLDLASTERAVAAKVEGIMAHGHGLTRAKARMISQVYTIAATAILDDAFCDAPYDVEEIEEFKHMVNAYLDLYFKD